MYRTLEFSWPFHFHNAIYFPQLSRWLQQGLLFHFKDEKTEAQSGQLGGGSGQERGEEGGEKEEKGRRERAIILLNT